MTCPGAGPEQSSDPKPGARPSADVVPTLAALQRRRRRKREKPRDRVPRGGSRKPRQAGCAQGHQVFSAALGVELAGTMAAVGVTGRPQVARLGREAGPWSKPNCTAQTASPLTSGPRGGKTAPDGSQQLADLRNNHAAPLTPMPTSPGI